MRQSVQNMTSGSPTRLIVSFALPLMCGNIFQQCYTVVDTIVVGQGVGVEALASLGASDWFNWLVLGVVTGLAQGFGIRMSQEFGAGRYVDLRRTVRDSVVLMTALTAIILLLSQLLVLPVLNLLGTPDNIRPGSELYLRVLYVGLPLTAFYNLTASILRSLGDSKIPLVAMIAASLLNVGLDVLFVFAFHWGIGGAAAATVLAQGVAGVICLVKVLRISELRGQEPFAWPTMESAVGLMKLSVPVSFQNVIISIGGMVVQSVVNGFGFLFIAGYTATNKLYGIIEMAAISYGYAMTTYVGQNYGAGDLKRVRQGVFRGLLTALLTSLVVSVLMLVFGRNLLLLFISGEASEQAQALDVAYRYLSIMCIFLMILYVLHIYRCVLQGLGDTVWPMASGIVEFAMRVGSVLLLKGIIAEYSVFFAEILAWTGAAVLLWVCYQVRMKRLEERARLMSESLIEGANHG